MTALERQRRLSEQKILQSLFQHLQLLKWVLFCGFHMMDHMFSFGIWNWALKLILLWLVQALNGCALVNYRKGEGAESWTFLTRPFSSSCGPPCLITRPWRPAIMFLNLLHRKLNTSPKNSLKKKQASNHMKTDQYKFHPRRPKPTQEIEPSHWIPGNWWEKKTGMIVELFTLINCSCLRISTILVFCAK